ncbi:hypothetical protein M472_09610 [Sphingobacterium paucimobilis HER1398]|uniref:Fibrobacter succinogenes major paralogous domain-containing protein n=2 Tax=Sphingobacterium TaxID=28453 RepID=U2HBB8_9SPHI|nr:hypothetical protein M472_09610 [Sphingobacterium paucimobilis HER1398]
MVHKILGCVLIALVILSCGKDEGRPDVTPIATGVVKDKEGNSYNWVQIGDQQWTTANARGGVPFFRLKEPPSFRYTLISVRDTTEVNRFYGEYGNLYSFEDAVTSAPDGWHLPTDEDWQTLEKRLGLSDSESNRIGWRGSGIQELLLNVESGSTLGLKLGGLVLKKGRPFSLTYTYFKDYGYYWTSTVKEESAAGKHVYFRKLVAGSDQMGRYTTNVNDLFMSVRYVKNLK